jgi:prepilin-type N-terminal cleavage/methylation domain-containing protein
VEAGIDEMQEATQPSGGGRIRNEPLDVVFHETQQGQQTERLNTGQRRGSPFAIGMNMSKNPLRRMRDSAGFSLIEMLMVVGLMGILMPMAVLQIGQSQPTTNSDGAMRVVLAQLTTARELAITQRRYYRVTFTDGGNQVQVIREETPGPTLTVISSVVLEGGVKFTLVNGVSDTPELFGKASGVDFGTATQIRFTTDGTLIDQNGAPLNGTVFMAVPNIVRSARAATVFGSTGRVRGYRFDGAVWKLV